MGLYAVLARVFLAFTMFHFLKLFNLHKKYHLARGAKTRRQLRIPGFFLYCQNLAIVTYSHVIISDCFRTILRMLQNRSAQLNANSIEWRLVENPILHKGDGPQVYDIRINEVDPAQGKFTTF